MFYSSLFAPLRARRARFRLFAFLFGIMLVASLWPFIPKAALQSNGERAAAQKLSKADFVPGEILVRFRPGAASAKGRASMPLMMRDQGLEIPMQVETLGETEIVEGLRLARVAPENTLRAIEALKSRPDVLYAEPNYIRRKSSVPNDTQYAPQWALKNNGQSGGTAGADIHAEQAWDITTGSRSVVVGVVDEGIDINHPDLWTSARASEQTRIFMSSSRTRIQLSFAGRACPATSILRWTNARAAGLSILKSN